MLADQLFQFLERSDVSEIALQAGRPPCAVVDGTLRRLSAHLLREEDVVSVLAAARGQLHLDHLDERPSWEFEHAVGTIVVTAARDAQGLRAVLRLRGAAVVEEPLAPPPPRAAAPKRVSKSPKAKSQRPPRPGAAPVAGRTHAQPAERGRPGQNAAPSSPKEPDAVSLPPPPEDSELIQTNARPGTAAASPRRSRSSSGPPASGATRASELDADSGLSLAEPAAPVAAPARVVLPPFRGDKLDDLLRSALEQRASDIHVIAERPPLLRLAGDLQPQGTPLTAAEVERLLMPRVPADRLAELERTGSCDFALEHPAYGRFRANVSRQRTGLKLTARPIGASIPTLQELGMPEAIRKAMQHHQGLIVITGPTGHGKTTTMAALVGIINQETTHHVITVEDPIEYVHPIRKAVISQREVGKHTKTFQAALKGSLREDPDVIVVGELRDTETVRMALSASETGHLVISTMNTPSAAKAIERLIDLFPPGDQPQVRMTLAGGLRLIISQRLLPTADRKQLCAAAELLPGSTALWSLIRDNRTYQITSLQQRGKSLGIVRLDDSLAELVRSGRTSLELAREQAETPLQFDALVAGRPIVAPPPEDDSATGAAAKRGIEMGKNVLSRAGKLFGNESK